MSSAAAHSNGCLTAVLPGAAVQGAEQRASGGGASQLTQLLNDGGQQALVYSDFRAGEAAPLILTLRGAGSDPHDGMHHLIGHADTYGCILLSPKSQGSTWDMLRGSYGPDVAFIGRALQKSFERFTVNTRQHVCASVFSDGASYALSIGVANSNLFSHVAAFSSGFMRPPVSVGMPNIYISHGQSDRVLRIDYRSRRIVPRLERSGYIASQLPRV